VRRAGGRRVRPRPRETRPEQGRGRQLRLLLAVLCDLTSDDWTVDELAADLGVHRRTVWRVLAELRRARLPLEATRDGGHVVHYRLPARWRRA
jgi:predicted DNA-binding transcriptional regulator YafY